MVIETLSPSSHLLCLLSTKREKGSKVVLPTICEEVQEQTWKNVVLGTLTQRAMKTGAVPASVEGRPPPSWQEPSLKSSGNPAEEQIIHDKHIFS